MVPIPSEAEEDGRRPLRERQELIKERLALTNKIDGMMATLGIGGYRPLRRDRRHERLETLRQPSGDPLPVHACQSPADALVGSAGTGAQADQGAGEGARCRRGSRRRSIGR